MSAAATFPSLAGCLFRSRLPPLPPQVPLPLPLLLPPVASRRLLPPLTSIASCHQPPPQFDCCVCVFLFAPAALPPPRSRPLLEPSNAAAAIEHSCRHKMPAIFDVHRRRLTPPPAVSLPPTPPLITIFSTFALPPPCRSPSPRPSNAHCPLSRCHPSPTQSKVLPITTSALTPDVNPRHHRHLDLIVASAPPHHTLPLFYLYARRRQEQSSTQ